MKNIENGISLAKHAIGLDRKKPYHRHGKAFYKPYRNYYCATKDNYAWIMLIRLGYAERGEESNRYVYYHLTRKGLDWLGRVLDINIKDGD